MYLLNSLNGKWKEILEKFREICQSENVGTMLVIEFENKRLINYSSGRRN